MPNLLIHIGQGKTGSTSIQNFLRTNPEMLRDAGVLFPETGKHTNHQDIFSYLTDDVKQHDPRLRGTRADDRKRALGKTFWHAARDTMDKTNPRLVVLSCENQFRPFAPAALLRLTDELRPLFSRIDVCAYLRDPASHFLSSAQQDLKKRPDFTIPSRSYFRDTLEPWSLHGPGPLTCIRFARSELADQDVVTDFSRRFVGVDPASARRSATEDNTSLSPEAMEIMQLYLRGEIEAPTRYHARRTQRMKALVQEADSKCSGFSRPRLRKGLKEAIEARALDLDWLERTFGLRFPEIGQPAMSPEEADRRIRGLSRVSDVCTTDPDRIEALQKEMARLAAGRRSLFDLFARRACN
ncbi:hypothetical protein [Mameliella sp.]|uniref:hypothetical protein n=1 Tax=Mameliella sp. TaxID=1924940 RepID=UPI003BA9C6B8